MRSKALCLLIFILICSLLISGCNINSPSSSNLPKSNSDINIVASFYPVYIFSLNIAYGIKGVKVIDMTKPTTGCLHDYSVTTQDMKNLENADFFIINGVGMESFMDKVKSKFPSLKTIDSSDGIKLIKNQNGVDYNPHIWVSISNAILQVKNIGEQLSLLDPKNSADYKRNTDIYVAKLKALRDKMHKSLDKIKTRDIITFHEAFPYFADEFGLNILGVIEREPGSEPSAKELADTIDKVNKLNVKALFAEPQYSTKAAQVISNETGAKMYFLDPVVTGSASADAYINIMEANLKVLEEALV